MQMFAMFKLTSLQFLVHLRVLFFFVNFQLSSKLHNKMTAETVRAGGQFALVIFVRQQKQIRAGFPW